MDITWDDYLGENWWGWQESSSTEVEPTFSPSTGMSTWSGYWEDVHFFSADFFGTHLTFQWHYSPDKITWSSISGATRATYEISSMGSIEVAGGQGYYKCIATNSKGTAFGIAQAICIEHPFNYEREGLGGMGTYERYDQRADYKKSCNFYIGITDTSVVYKNGVFAWAKGCTIQDANANNFTTFYVGCYGASDCRLRLENCTIPKSSTLYVSAWSSYLDGAVSTGNSVEVVNSILTGRNYYISIGSECNTAQESSGNSLLMSECAVVSGFYVYMAAGYGLHKNNECIITDAGTQFILDPLSSGSTYHSNSQIYLTFEPLNTGNHIDFLNNCLVRMAKAGSDLEPEHLSQTMGFSQINSELEPSSDLLTIRFGGGYLAYFGNCVGPLLEGYDSRLEHWKWDFSDWSSGRDILPLEVLQVRNTDGTWRAAVEDDFTVTYCTTDAEGLAATGGRYDGLAGYTIITAGATIS